MAVILPLYFIILFVFINQKLEENTFAVIGTMETICRHHINKNYATDCEDYSREGMWGFLG